ncbi:MAG: helix-turn-helix transcriptional regulator [Clostridia bacterium]|nr:helix-turn-helix transcriptional regulator [Clostridia bacterium]
MKLNLGENIRNYRKKIGLTQEMLADRLGVSGQSVSRWENGTTYPDMEFMPVMARLFGCTTDDLFGYGEPEKKLNTQELGNMLNDAVCRKDAVRMEELLRMIRHEYLEEWCHLYHCLTGALRPGKAFAEHEGIMKEYRLLMDTYLEEGKQRGTKTYMTQQLFCVLDDRECKETWQKYTVQDNCDLTELGLFLRRAQLRGETDILRHLIEEKKVHDLFGYAMREPVFLCHTPVDVNDPWSCERGLEPGDPMAKRRASETRLKVLHGFCGITPDEMHPLSGDGDLDLFWPVYVTLGLAYAAQLAATGDCDLALTVLEDWAGLIEQAMVFPHDAAYYKENGRTRDGEEVPVRSPELTEIKGFRAPMVDRDGTILCIRTGTIWKHPGRYWPRSYVDHTIPLNMHGMLTDMFLPQDHIRASWLNPIRNHPRYLEVVRRLNAVLPELAKCPHSVTLTDEHMKNM